MTKLWGPLGWMTLHSASIIYPDHPTHEERLILQRFLTLYMETITCNSCKQHFQNMVMVYKEKYPDFLDSKVNFFLFVARCHNTVNKRLDKPRPATMKDCLDTFISNTKNFSGKQYRDSYINYLIRNWTNERTGDGNIFRRSAIEMQKINNEYWNARDQPIINLTFQEFDVLEIISETRSKTSNGMIIPRNITGGGFIGGKLKLGIR